MLFLAVWFVVLVFVVKNVVIAWRHGRQQAPDRGWQTVLQIKSREEND